MVTLTRGSVNPPARFRKPPWDRTSPQWRKIDALLPADHPARIIRQALDQLDDTEVVAAYHGTGSEAYPPNLMLAIVLCELYNNRHSPARWACDVVLHDELKWLGFGIRPSRSVCYAFRDRMAGRLPELLRQVLAIARAQGLTTAERVALDGTAVAAVASRHNLLNHATLEARLERLDAACVADTSTATATATATAQDVPALPRRPAWMASTPRGRRRQQHAYNNARQLLEAKLAHNARRPPSERRDPQKIVISPSEPTAVLGLDKLKVFRPLYNAQLAPDLDSPFVLGYGVFALPTDIGTLAPMVETLRTLTGRLPTVLLADAKYANLNDIATCDRAGITLYAPDGKDRPPTRVSATTVKKARRLSKSAFTWDGQRQEYRCPQGHSMPYAKSQPEERAGGTTVVYDYYRCPQAQCAVCPRRAACVGDSSQGRTVTRARDEALIERLRERMASAEAKAVYRRRRETVERSFADLKRHRGLDRFHGRGLERASTELGLHVLVHNLIVLVRCQNAAKTNRLTTEVPRDVST
jgi:transposase